MQLNVEGLTPGKCSVIEHLAMKHEALVILLQETHCTNAEKLVIPNYTLAGSILSRKHGLATFVHERLNWTLIGLSPSESEIEWMCVGVDGYNIVNVYKPPLTRIYPSAIPVFPHPCLYAGDFNCQHVDWGYSVSSPDGECLAVWATNSNLALLHNPKGAASFSLDAGTQEPTLTWHSQALVQTAASQKDKFWRSSLGPNIDPRS